MVLPPMLETHEGEALQQGRKQPPKSLFANVRLCTSVPDSGQSAHGPTTVSIDARQVAFAK